MEKKELHVRILFNMMLKSLQEIAKVDVDLQEELEEFDAKIQWKIGGIKGYQIFKDCRVSYKIDDEIEDPDLTLILTDLDFAKDFFSGKVDGTTAFMSGDLKIDGDLQIALIYGTLSDYIYEYLEPIIERTEN
ncbi:MAG: SCP2 sterol-binding domain-containing protein [Candidatus Hermodarchaeota archaeon]